MIYLFGFISIRYLHKENPTPILNKAFRTKEISLPQSSLIRKPMSRTGYKKFHVYFQTNRIKNTYSFFLFCLSFQTKIEPTCSEIAFRNSWQFNQHEKKPLVVFKYIIHYVEPIYLLCIKKEVLRHIRLTLYSSTLKIIFCVNIYSSIIILLRLRILSLIIHSVTKN